jgi:hypothetical protein
MKKVRTKLTFAAISFALMLGLSPVWAADDVTTTNAVTTNAVAIDAPATNAVATSTAATSDTTTNAPAVVAPAPEAQPVVTVPSALPLPGIFGDNMVLQQKQRVPVWGWSKPGTEVTVKFAGQIKCARAGADGRWEVNLNSLKASSQPADLVIEAGETRTFTNILVGEVWLCSGQSNMEKPLGKQTGQKP